MAIKRILPEGHQRPVTAADLADMLVTLGVRKGDNTPLSKADIDAARPARRPPVAAA